MEIAKDGIAIYQSDDSELHKPKPKTPEAALAMAKEYYEEWFPSAAGMLETAVFSKTQGRLKDAAFLMHQSTERLLNCVLLVCCNYVPHVHNLAFLRTQAERIDRRLVFVWPRDTRKERAMFEKLKEAYIKARYSKFFQISVEELDWIGEQIEELGRVVHAVCSERIAHLESAAKVT